MPVDLTGDEIGAPDPTTTTRRHLNGDHRSGWCLTGQCNHCTYPPCPHQCHQAVTHDQG